MRLSSLVTTLETRPRFWPLLVMVVASLVGNTLATDWLNRSYAQSRFPVPYFEAQLSFSAEKLQGWYGQLLQMGTLDIYWRTQFIDHVFIFTVLALHVLALVLVSRLFPITHRGRRLFVWLALAAALAPLADTLENLVSYVMLSNPLAFPAGLAWLYSTLAAIKFVVFTLSYAAVVVGVLWGVLVRWRTRV